METLDVVVLYMARLVQEEMDQGKKLRELGKEWGLNHATLATLRRNLRGGGQHVETKIAEAIAGGSVDELRRRAKEWHAKHPGWRPKGYEPPDAPPKNSAFAWWNEEAARFAAQKPKLAWAVAAAAEKPQGDEPRADRRRAYVERAVDSLLDLPEKTVAALERRYGSKGR
jgi:hypothetical protein